MKTNTATIINQLVQLQKLPIGLQLNREQVGYFQNLWSLPKIFADSFFFGITQSHRLSSSGIRIPANSCRFFRQA